MAEEKKAKTEKTKRWPPEDTRQHMKTARAELRESYRSLFPPEFVRHRRAARREMLLALRSLVDHALERMEVKETK
jgi:hypothetical protein